MDRMIYIDGTFGGKSKYKLKKEYEGFGIYQEYSGELFVHQEYLITNGDKILVSNSYNNLCYDEMLDTIDRYNKTKKFGHKVIARFDKTREEIVYYIHQSGTNA